MQGIIGKLDIRTNSIEKIANVGCAWGWPNNWSTDKTGKLIAFKDAKSNAPEDIWIMNPDGSGKKQLTNMNPQASSLKYGEEQTVRWNSYDGTPIEGVLIKPFGYISDNQYPLITIVHGGPEWSWWLGCWQAGWLA